MEVFVSGNDEALKAFINWCWEGPSRALVTNVIVNETEDQEFEDFKIIRD